MKSIYLIGIVFLVLFLAGCASQVTEQLTEDSTVQSTGEVKNLLINAYNWGFTTNEVEINKGDTVRVKLTSTSGVHGIDIPEFGISIPPVGPGQEQIFEFTATKSGSFTYFCNIACGEGHNDMKEQLIIT